MRLIYNDALNKRIAPYLERLTKKRTSLDKETMTLLDVFMQYFNMDTRYGTYSDKLEPCIIHIIQEEKIKSVANLFDGKLNKVLRYLLGDEYANLFHTYLKLKARCPFSFGCFAPGAARGRAAGTKYFYNYKGGRLFCKGKAARARPQKAAGRAPFG